MMMSLMEMKMTVKLTEWSCGEAVRLSGTPSASETSLHHGSAIGKNTNIKNGGNTETATNVDIGYAMTSINDQDQKIDSKYLKGLGFKGR